MSATTPAPRPTLLPGQSLCDHCTAKCCKYFAWPIEKPTRRADFDYMRAKHPEDWLILLLCGYDCTNEFFEIGAFEDFRKRVDEFAYAAAFKFDIELRAVDFRFPPGNRAHFDFR